MTTAQTKPASMSRWQNIVAAAVIVLGALAAYHNSISTPFVFDDMGTIAQNASIRHLWPIWDALSPPRATGMTTSGRPLVNLSFAVNYVLGGTAVWGYHVLNLVIHIFAGLTLLGIVRRTLLRPPLCDRFGEDALPLATAVAVVWTLHPLHTESVTYVVQRAESLMGLFYLLTLYCFIRGSKSAKSGVWYSLCVVACLLGMATKEVMVSAPLIVFLYDRTFVEGTFREAWRRHWRLYVGLASTWVVLGYLLIGSGNRAGTAGFGTHVGRWDYARTQCWAVTQYLWLSALPHPLIFDYGVWLAGNTVEIALRAAILVLLLAGVIVALRHHPVIGFLGVWFFLILAPSSSVMPVVSQTVAEHRVYLSLAAVVALVVPGLYIWIGRSSFAVFLALSVGLGFLTMQRNRDYRSPIAIWSDTVSKRPGNLRAQYNLGFVLEQAGKTEDAIGYYQQVLLFNPDYPEAHEHLGNILMQAGRVGEAIGHFERMLQIKPEDPEAHNNMGVALERTGQIPEAIEHYERALRIDPDNAEAHNNLGGVLARLGQVQEALGHWERAARIDPHFAEVHNNLGSALLGLGKVQEAISEYEQALRIKPDYAKAQYNLGLALEEAGRKQEAIEHYEQAVRLKPDFTEAQNKLAQLRPLQ
jgi:tetratricopeptide (TPR) repeat protein